MLEFTIKYNDGRIRHFEDEFCFSYLNCTSTHKSIDSVHYFPKSLLSSTITREYYGLLSSLNLYEFDIDELLSDGITLPSTIPLPHLMGLLALVRYPEYFPEIVEPFVKLSETISVELSFVLSHLIPLIKQDKITTFLNLSEDEHLFLNKNWITKTTHKEFVSNFKNTISQCRPFHEYQMTNSLWELLHFGKTNSTGTQYPKHSEAARSLCSKLPLPLHEIKEFFNE